jgi:hypothetical protein
MRPLAVYAAFAALFVLSPASPAQILRISLKEQKLYKSFKVGVVNLEGEDYLVGEAKSGVKEPQGENGKWDLPDNTPGHPGVFELWVPDLENPKACPYKVVKGEKSSAGGKTSIRVQSQDVKTIGYYMKDQSLWGLSQEYIKRLAAIDEMRKTRDSAAKGSPDWNRKQALLIQGMERMKSWLGETIYAKAGDKYAKEIEKENKAQKDAKEQRLVNAKASIKMVPTPEGLTKAGKDAYGDSIVFHVQESTHFRIVYKEEIGDERVKGLLELAETLLDGFRITFVDPYVSEDFKDYFTDDMLSEWYFGPDDIPSHKKFTAAYYGVGWETGPKAEKLDKYPGGSVRRAKPPVHIHFLRTGEQNDLDGNISHHLGHDLVAVHYNQDRPNDPCPWLNEGVGNWLSLEYLGRNSVQCVSLKDLEYAKKIVPEGEQTDELLKGTADLYHRLALDKGAPLDTLAIKDLATFEDEDVAKSFSMFSYIAKAQGEKGQRWLRACLGYASTPNTFVQQWRKRSEEIFGVTGKDVFSTINEEWKKYAEQQVGGAIKK